MEDENNKVQQIPIDSIDDPKSPIRTRADENAIRQLTDSIRDVGLIQPILVRPRNGRFEAIAGHRRLIACRGAGLLTVPAIVGNVDDARSDVIRLHENLGREDVSIVDQARFLFRIAAELTIADEELAKRLGRSISFIRERFALLKWPEEMIDTLENQKLSYSAAKWLAKITDDKARRYYLEAAIRSGITSQVAYDWYCAWKNQKLPKPPPLEEKNRPDGEPTIHYYTSRCKFCGAKIAEGEEVILYAHQKCVEEIERSMKPTE